MLLRKSWDLSVRQQWLCHTERWILVDVSRSIKPRRYIGCYYRLAEKTFQEDRFVSSTVTRLINHRLLAVIFPQFISGNYRTITMFGQKLERFRFVLDKNGRHWI